jgi:hypothetical protein
MAESVEHQFLSNSATAALNELSHTNLYAYVEAERRKFDFACELIRDWSRPLVGQTLWNHTAGVDKDLRMLLLDRDAEICVYIARDTIKARRLISEVMKDFRDSSISIEPHRLRIIWVPHDFDADEESQRDLIYQSISDRVCNDILMNVVFGNLTAADVRFFIRTSGTAGLHLAILHAISVSPERYSSNKELAHQLGVSAGAIRERLLRLLGCGFLSQFGGGAFLTQTTLKGRVFLDFCGQLEMQAASDNWSAELLHIMRLLDLHYAPSALERSKDSLHLAGPFLTEVPEMATGRLIATITAAVDRWGIDLVSTQHHIWKGDPIETASPFIKNEIDKLRAERRR